MNLVVASIFAFAALAAALLPATSLAAPAPELTVTGTIRPSACSFNFDNHGVVGYDTIASSVLEPRRQTRLAVKSINFAVSCGAPRKIKLKFADNRKDTRVPGIVANFTPTSADHYNFGLGKSSNINIGGYYMRIDADSVRADAVRVDDIYSTDGGLRWQVGARALDTVNYFSFAAINTTDPVAFRQLNATILLRAILDVPERLPVSQEIQLDGSVSVEMSYF